MRKTDYEFKYLGNCSVCGTSFETRKTTLISRKEGISHVYAQCVECKSSVIIFVIKSTAGFVTTVGMLTDMTKQDLDKFKKRKPITADDVLELHKALENK
ncbi:MAG: hypothetical protein WDZ39_01055 [Candidatus Spechtbacterales bacterium]